MKAFLTLVFVTLSSLTVNAQSNDPLEKESLKGLSGLGVLVNVIEDSPNLERDGLTKDQIQTDVELRLRRARMPVLTVEEVKELPRRPILLVTLIANRSDALSKLLGENFYSFSIQIDCKQAARLNGMLNGRVLLVTTWSNGAVGMTSRRNIRSIRDSISDYVDKFLNDYLAANPK